MPAVAAVAAVAGIAGAVDSRNARKDAADGVEEANIESATQLGEAGRLGRQDVQWGAGLAHQDIDKAAYVPAIHIENYTDDGLKAVELYKNHTLNDLDINSPLSRIIGDASMAGVNRNIYGNGAVNEQEIQRQAGITASGFNPTYRDMLASASDLGAASLDDLAGLRQRQHQNHARVSAGSAAQQASALIGQGPALQQLGESASQARAMGDVASRNFRSSLIDTAAGAAGDYFGGR